MTIIQIIPHTQSGKKLYVKFDFLYRNITCFPMFTRRKLIESTILSALMIMGMLFIGSF